jgi:hypothetical protein
VRVEAGLEVSRALATRKAIETKAQAADIAAIDRDILGIERRIEDSTRLQHGLDGR